MCHEMQHGNVQVMTSEMFHENRNHILSHVKVTLRISASQDINMFFLKNIPESPWGSNHLLRMVMEPKYLSFRR